MQRYPTHLGSGWAQIVRAIWQALNDGKLAVVEEGLGTLAEAVSAADAAGCFQTVAPALLGLAVIAATLESHPHLCFAALKCIEAMTVVLLRQRIGTLVRFADILFALSSTLYVRLRTRGPGIYYYNMSHMVPAVEPSVHAAR